MERTWNPVQRVGGYCCGCGKAVEVYPGHTKHGEANRYGMRECSCGSRTAAVLNFHARKSNARFKRPDKLRRRTFQIIRQLKRIYDSAVDTWERETVVVSLEA